MLHVRSVRHLSGYRLWVVFDDGREGEVDLQGELHGPVFEPLRRVEFFQRATVDPELETVVWPNGADLAPEFLRARCRLA